MGGGWKILRDCPACSEGETIGLDDDRISVCSGKSGVSGKSTSGKSRSSRSRSRGRSSRRDVATAAAAAVVKDDPQYDGDGYCPLHPSVRIAKKKTMGGWKILLPHCPDCQNEGHCNNNKSRGRNKSRSRSSLRRSLSRVRSRSKGRDKDDDDEDTQSVSSSLSKYSSRSNRSKSSHRSKSSSSRKKPPTGAIPSSSGGAPYKVKNLKIRDQNRVPGRYSGYVDENHRPDGKGIMRYENGMEWSGVWRMGEQVSGKLGGCKSNF